jgi:hypothetical protein
MTTMLKLGVSKVEITPAHPVPLAGFAIRSGLGPFTDVSMPIYARIFVMESSDPSGNELPKRAVIVSADLIWWGSERVPAFKAQISGRCGIDPDAILLHGTHTHSGPQTSDRFTSYLGMPDFAYLKELEDRVLDGIVQATADLEPVRVERGTGSSRLAINRRGLRVTPPELRVTDHELNVLRYSRADGKAKGILVHYACHPVITNENKISSEYVGVAMEAIEQQVGLGCVCGFLQGTCGDQNPGDGKEVIRGNHARVVEVGLRFASDIAAALAGPMTTLPPIGLRVRSLTVPLPLASLPELGDLAAGEALPDVHGEWHRLQRLRYSQLKPELPLTMTLLQLTESCSLLAMDAEVVVDFGLYIKRQSNRHILPLGYTNGMLGYVPTADILAEGGYEAVDSTYYFAMPSVFAPEVEMVVKRAVDTLLGGDWG